MNSNNTPQTVTAAHQYAKELDDVRASLKKISLLIMADSTLNQDDVTWPMVQDMTYMRIQLMDMCNRLNRNDPPAQKYRKAGIRAAS